MHSIASPFSTPVKTKRATLLSCVFLLGLTLKVPEAHSQPTTQEAEAAEPGERIIFPRTLQITPYIGWITKGIPQVLAPEAVSSTSLRLTPQRLRVIGIGADISIIQIRKFLWKHFHSYPQLGIQVHYGRLQNKGNLAGGAFYIAPQHNYQASWEFFPRLGVGLYYAHIPVKNFKDPKDPKGGNATPTPDVTIPDFRKGASLDLSLTLICKIKFNPHWTLSPSVGFNYVPYLSSEDDKTLVQTKPPTSRHLRIVTVGLGLGYTFNPSRIRYPSLKNLKINRVDLGMLHAIKKYQPSPPKSTNKQPPPKSQANSNNSSSNDKKYYYVGGIYAHWSIRVSQSNAITLSTEWIKDWATKEAIKDRIKKDHLKASFLAGHEFLWGKLIFGQQIGFYVINNADYESSFYGRLGLDYRITEHFFVGASYKADLNIMLNSATAFLQSMTRNEPKMDFIDFRIGYSF